MGQAAFDGPAFDDGAFDVDAAVAVVVPLSWLAPAPILLAGPAVGLPSGATPADAQ